MKKTKIICTLGPRTDDDELMRSLVQKGMDIARFNFSHGTHEEQKARMDRLKRIRDEEGKPIAILLDTKGPEIRTGILKDGKKVALKEGDTFVLTAEELTGDAGKVSITYEGLVDDVQVGSTILIDDGLIEMCVEEITDTDIVCTVLSGGPVSNHKGVNVPGVVLSMPYISEVDREDILFGIEMGYEFLAASFARSKEDILEVREILDAHHSDMKIIAKIENMQGIENLEEILEVSDGVMVARGDMGVEIPIEEIPALQKRMIKMAVNQGKHVITATQMLESMIKNPRPTRAEATDIANAIYDGTTAIMLSGESAAGKYPVEAVKTMAKIAETAEISMDYRTGAKWSDGGNETDITTAIAHATCSAAMDLRAAAIITVTLSGFTAEAISRFKPENTIIGCTVSRKVFRQLNLQWGVKPLMIKEEESSGRLFAAAVAEAKKAGYVKEGDVVVITAGVPLGTAGTTNMIHVMEVE